MHWHAIGSDVWRVIWDATWGNNMAAIEWTVALAVAGYLGRHHIGRVLAAWWAFHHGPHAIAQQREALRQHEAEKAAREDGTP